MDTFEHQPKITKIEVIFVKFGDPVLYINRGLKERVYRSPNPHWTLRLILLTHEPNFETHIFSNGWSITRKFNLWAQARKDY